MIELIEALERAGTPREAGELAVEAGRASTGADGGWFEVATAGKGLEIVGAVGSAGALDGCRPARPGALAEEAARAPEPVGVEERAGRPTLQLPEAGRLEGELLVVPLRGEGELLGTLVLHRGPERGAFDPAATTRARVVAGAVGLALRRMAVEREARRAAERMGHFVRAVGHDLKNPLGAVAGYIQLLESGVRGELTPEQREWTDRIGGVVEEMLALVGDLLDLARIETGALDLDLQTVPLSAVLGEAVEVLRAAGAAAEVGLETDVPEDLPVVTGDPGRILQILEKLFDLMVHSVAGGGTVRLEVRSGERRGAPACVVGLRGTAPALVKALREKAPFEGIFHVDTASDRPPVTGLELALSQRIARMQDGEVRIGCEGGEAVLQLWLPARSRR